MQQANIDFLRIKRYTDVLWFETDKDKIKPMKNVFWIKIKRPQNIIENKMISLSSISVLPLHLQMKITQKKRGR